MRRIGKFVLISAAVFAAVLMISIGTNFAFNYKTENAWWGRLLISRPSGTMLFGEREVYAVFKGEGLERISLYSIFGEETMVIDYSNECECVLRVHRKNEFYLARGLSDSLMVFYQNMETGRGGVGYVPMTARFKDEFKKALSIRNEFRKKYAHLIPSS